MARPSKYTPQLIETICNEIATSCKGLRSICAGESMPALSTVMRWLSEHKEFQEQYARARESQADLLVEEMISIADDHTRDIQIIEIAPGIKGESVDHEVIQRSKLRVDTRKWIASKLRPKKYGDKIDITSDDKPLGNGMQPEQFAEILNIARNNAALPDKGE